MVIMVSMAMDRFPLRRNWRWWACDVTDQRLSLTPARRLLYHVTLVVVLSTCVTLATAANTTNDEGFCQTRYLSSGGNVSRVTSQAVGVAAILEMRSPAGRQCGEVSGVNLQVAAALLWAVQLLNGDLSPQGDSFIPGIHLELQVYDDCSQEILAARLVSEVLNIHPNNCVLARPPLAGVIGTSISPTTTRIASLLADTHVPQFGVSATLPELSYSSLYPSFFRTVPSDLMQSKVLVQMVTRLKWNYVAGMYTRDNYGTQGFQEFKRLAAEAGICIFREQSFLHSDSDMEDQMEVFIRMLLIDMVSTGNSLGVVYFGQSLEARRLFQMIQDRRAKWHDQQKFNQIHWVFSDGVGTSVEVAKRITEYSSTFLSISPAPLPLRDFRRFFVDLLRSSQKPDPYWSTLLAEYIAQELPCDPRASSSCDVEMSFHISDYLPAALDAIYSLAALLKTAHKLKCQGGGLCPELMEAVRGGLLQSVQPKALNYSEFFDNDYLPEEFRNNRVLVSNEYGDFVAANMPLYYISMARNGAWKKIGQYTNGSVSIDASTDFTNVGSSECRTSCTQCRRSDTSVFYHQPGDLLLLGLYSIHKPESPTSFRCGQYRGQSSSVVALEAFLQTLQALAADEGHQPGVAYPRVGGLVLDDCYNSLTAVSLLSGLFSKKINLTSSSTGEVIDMDKVVAVIGSQSSTVTLSSLSVLTPLRMPMISYSSTSADLDDRVSYPFFSRTVPSDSVQARALLNLAKLMNVTYLGAFHQNNNYGIRGMQSFIAMAEEAGVCVETSIPLEESTSQVELLSHLRYLGNQDVKVIVAFVTQLTAVNILDALQGYSVNFVFLASEAWGTGPGTLQGVRGMKARGSLVLTVDTTREVGGVDMETYLRTLTPALAITETWTRDMWEALMMCNLPGSFENEYPSPCNQSARITADIVKTLAHDQKVVETINSVYSVVNALRSLCSSQSSQTAAAECAARVDGEGLTRAIRTVELRDKSGQTFRPFLDSGNGNTGFTVYNVQKTSSSGYAYVKVGSYDPSTGLNVQRGDLVFYNQLGQPQSAIVSSCAHKDRCTICNNAQVTATPGPLAQPTSQKQDTSGPLVVGVAVLGVVCILLLVLLGVGVLLARRSRVLTLKIFGRYGRRNGAHTNGNNGLESRRDPGRINSAFTPTSPRVSLPLPPLPTGDYDRCSLSSPSPSNNSQAAREPTPSLRGQTSQQSPSRTQHPQFENLQQTEALRLQELWPRQRQQQQEEEEEENVSGLWTESQGRPRSSSTPRPVRPNFLPLREARQLDNNHSCSSECLGVGQKSQSNNFRPRAWSDDAAAGKRLGKLTELDRQLIAYFINRQKQGVSTSSGVQDTADPVRRDQLTVLGGQYQGQQRRQSSPQHANLQTMLLPHPTGDPRPTTLQASRPHPVTYVPVPAGGALGHGLYLHAIPSCNSSLYLHAVAGSCTGLQTPNIPKSVTEGHSTSAGSDVASPGHFVTSPVSPQSDASSSVFDSPKERNDVAPFAENRSKDGGNGTRTPETAFQAQHPTCACANADAVTSVGRFWKDSPQNAAACRPVVSTASPEMLHQVATVPLDPAARDPGEVSGRTVMPVLVSPTGAGSGQCSIVYVPYAIVPQQDLSPSWQGQTNDTRLASASPRVTAPNRRPRLGTGTLRDPRFSAGIAKSNSMSQQGAALTPVTYPANTTPADILSPTGGGGDCESFPYIQGYQLTPVPPQCGPVLTNSNNSNQSSTVDSGTGEDLPATYIQDGEVAVVI